ncbi:YraN family protein [Rhodobacteraceae bacterium NNCM2]|nr:YraN family protein [Coraliihabitans acroporae]
MSGRRFHAGLAAEDQAARHYEKQGATILERRLKTPEGEIDLIARLGEMLIFIEVKQRKRLGPDSPISPKQWQRLGLAANFYMMQVTSMTGAAPLCRFDAVIIGADGRLEAIENARIDS